MQVFQSGKLSVTYGTLQDDDPESGNGIASVVVQILSRRGSARAFLKADDALSMGGALLAFAMAEIDQIEASHLLRDILYVVNHHKVNAAATRELLDVAVVVKINPECGKLCVLFPTLGMVPEAGCPIHDVPKGAHNAE